MQVAGYVHIPAVHRQRAWSLMPVTLLYVGNVAFALMSLQNLNIPMYNTLKRMTPVIVLVTKASLASHCSQHIARSVHGLAQNAKQATIATEAIHLSPNGNTIAGSCQGVG